jgi:hypothetical protein
MFTTGRKLEILYTEVFEYAKSISNRIHTGKPWKPTQNQEIKMTALRIADFDVWFYLT